MSTLNTVADVANSSSNNSTSSSIKRQGVRNSTDKVTISRQNSRILKSKDLLLKKKNRISTKSKSVNSRWETVLNILLKILILVTVLLYVGKQIWIWVDDNDDNITTVSIPPGVVEFESRVSEFETSINKITKMAQDQLDVISETSKKDVHKNTNLEKDLQNLADRTNNLETSVTALQDSNFLPRSKFETILSDMKLLNIQISEDSHKGLTSLDDVRKYARDIVVEGIEKHAADGIGRLDYALASGGGRVIKHSKAYNYNFFGIVKGLWSGGIHVNAHKMLEPSFGEPGQCFPLQGSSGFVDVRLRTAIILDAVTLEHVTKSVAYDRSSAPKDCHIYGLIEEHSNDDPLDKIIEKAILLKEFTYDLEKKNVQTFNIEKHGSPVAVNAVRFNFSSNHGSPSYTCIYRLRVHGHEPN